MKHLFRTLAALAMLAEAVVPFLIPPRYLTNTVVSVAIIAFVALTTAAISSWREERRRNKAEKQRDAREAASARNLACIADNLSVSRLASQSRAGRDLRDATLGSRAARLAGNLLDFLNEIGPRPKARIDYSMSDMEILDASAGEIGQWVNRVHHGYFARFKDPVMSMFHELRAEGLDDPELLGLIDPQVQRAERIRTIAEKLLVLASRLPRYSIEPAPEH